MTFPRPLRPKERDLLEFVLPVDRPGYRAIRDQVARLLVIGEGRRGEGNFVLGEAGHEPDISMPLPPVIAHGMVEATTDQFGVTVRAPFEGQIDVEIVSRGGGEIPDHFEEKRRWTYSSWAPGSPSPATGEIVREVAVDSARTMAIAAGERRLWLHDRTTGMVFPIPVTNFYNELMLVRQIRDPAIALRSQLLFESHRSYADADLKAAFIAYNAVKRRVDVEPAPDVPRRRGFAGLVRHIIRKRH